MEEFQHIGVSSPQRGKKKKSLLISILITAHLALNPEAGAPDLANKEFLQGSVAHPTGQNNKSRPSQVLSSRSQTWGHLFQPLPHPHPPATSSLVTESYCPQDSLGPGMSVSCRVWLDTSRTSPETALWTFGASRHTSLSHLPNQSQLWFPLLLLRWP